jgi:tetratricopeptide (TPR) repeat protein
VAAEKKRDSRRSHAKRYLDLAVAAEPELEGRDQAAVLDRLEHDLGDISAALDWSLSSGHIADALRAISALERFWRARSHVSAARRWLDRGLAQVSGVAPDVKADALCTAARLAMAQQDTAMAVPLLEEALTLFSELGKDQKAVFVLCELGFAALIEGDLETAETRCVRAHAVALEVGDQRALSLALMNLADVLSLKEDHEGALALYADALGIRQTLGDPFLIMDATYNLGVTAFMAGDLSRARGAFEVSLAEARTLGQALHIAAALFLLAELELLTGQAEIARRAIQESLAVYTQLESERDCGECLVVFGGIAAAEGAFAEAARLFGAAEGIRRDAPVSRFERPVLERFDPVARSALGAETFSALKHEGERSRYDVLHEMATSEPAL